MKQLLIAFILLQSVFITNAQWRLQIQAGPSFSLRPVNKDSLFSGQKQATHIQGRAVYFWGHLGLGLAVGYLKQAVRDDANKIKPPSFLTGIDTFTVRGGGVEAMYIVAGPEFCFACGDKLKLNLGIRAGVSIIKKETFQLLSQGKLQYQNELQSKAPFTFNAGLGAHYFINPHFGIGAMADWHHFALKANNKDIRRGINNILLLKQKKDFVNLGGSLVFKF
jgi:Outer membrane protein beta-barrel domain